VAWFLGHVCDCLGAVSCAGARRHLRAYVRGPYYTEDKTFFYCFIVLLLIAGCRY
jgi:hypothetical protein